MQAALRPALLAGSLAALAVAAPVAAQDLSAVPAGTYQVDPTHAYVNFSYSHFGLSNPTLSFDEFDLTMELDPADPTNTTVSLTIDVDSVVTGSEIWHDHLTSADWLDTEAYPEATFESTSVEAAGDGAYKVTGDLTLHGETKPVTMNVAINGAMEHPFSGDPVVGISASGEVLRSDFGVGKFAPNVSDEVTIEVTAELLMQK